VARRGPGPALFADCQVGQSAKTASSPTAVRVAVGKETLCRLPCLAVGKDLIFFEF